MPISPLTIVFPFSAVAALIAYALKGTKAEAAEEVPSGRNLTKEEWEKSKDSLREFWKKQGYEGEPCESGYRGRWLPYEGKPAQHVCEKIPEFEKVPAAPGEVPRIVEKPTNRPPVLLTPSPGKPNFREPSIKSLEQYQTPTLEKQIAIDKKAKQEKAKEKVYKESPAKEKIAREAKKEKEESVIRVSQVIKKIEADSRPLPAPPARPEKGEAPFLPGYTPYKPAEMKPLKEAKPSPLPKVEQKKKVSLAEWQADMKKKKLDNNCPDGQEPKFQQYAGTWAEYQCVPVGKQKVQVVSTPTGPAKVVEKGDFEPEAAQYVSEALSFTNPIEMVLHAELAEMEGYKRAGAYIRKKAAELAKTKKEIAKKEPAKKETTESVLASLSSSEKRQYEMLISQGVDKDFAPKLARFLSKNPSSKEAKEKAVQYQFTNPQVAKVLRDYANFEEKRAEQVARGMPTKPEAILKAVNQTKNPVELAQHADMLKAAGKPKTAEKVLEKAKTEAEKQGLKVLDEKESVKLLNEAKSHPNNLDRNIEIERVLRKAGFSKKADEVDALNFPVPKPVKKEVVKKEVVTPSGGKKTLPVAQKITVTKKQAEEDLAKAREEEKKAKDEAKKLADKAKKEEDPKEKARLEKERKKQEAFAKENAETAKRILELSKSRDPLAGLKDVSGEFQSGYHESDNSYHPVSISIHSPIDGVSDVEWLSFLNAIKTGKPNTITPSYELGMFGFGMRRLADYGLVENPRQVQYQGSTVWAGDWIEPFSLDAFLSDFELQKELIENDLSSKADYIKEKQSSDNVMVGKLVDGRKATLSGLLAVAFKTTENSFNKWLNASAQKRKQFPKTMRLFEKANGIF